jgi:predicted ATPase
VGRREELAALAKALDAARLVTLTGTGGVGKSRLAVEAAAQLVTSFPEGWCRNAVNKKAVRDKDFWRRRS